MKTRGSNATTGRRWGRLVGTSLLGVSGGVMALVLAGCGGSATHQVLHGATRAAAATRAASPAKPPAAAAPRVASPPQATASSAPCTAESLLSTVLATKQAPPDVKVGTYACQSGYALADLSTLDGDGAQAEFQDVGGNWNMLYLGTSGVDTDGVPAAIQSGLQAATNVASNSTAEQTPQSALNALVTGLGSTYATSAVITQDGAQWVAVATNVTTSPTTVGVSIYQFVNGSFVRQAIVPLTDAGVVLPASQNATPITTAQVTPSSDPDFIVETAGGSSSVTSVISDATGTWTAVPFDVNGQQEDSIPLATISGNTIHTQFDNCLPDCADGTESDAYFTYTNGVFAE